MSDRTLAHIIQMKNYRLGRRLFIWALLAITIVIPALSVNKSLGESAVIADGTGTSQILDPCPPIQTLPIGTGYNYATNSTYPIGASDPNWTVVADPDPNTHEPRPAFVVAFLAGAWKPPLSPTSTPPDGATPSQWISSYPSSSDNLNGDYVFEFCFCLRDGFTKPVLNLSLRADDTAEVFLNGTGPGNSLALTSSPIFNTAVPAQVTPPAANLFRVGKNCITVVVKNTGGGAMGLNLSGSITTKGPSLDSPQCCHPNGQIMGTKWNDLNGDGKQDPNEPGLPGWTITLSNGMTATTDNHGNYYFTNLPPGTYTVAETPQSNWSQTFPAGGGPLTVAVGANQVMTGQNFGNHQGSCVTVQTKEIKCNPDGSGNFTYTFNVTNNSGTAASTILLTPPVGSTFTLTPQQFNLAPPLANSQTIPLTVVIHGATSGQQICFTLTLLDERKACVCSNDVCITLPVCDCAQFFDEQIVSTQSGFVWTFTIINATPFTFSNMYVLGPVSPSSATITPSYFLISVPPGGQFTGTATITGAAGGSTVCFDLGFYDLGLKNCCLLKKHCITLPKDISTPR
jgi:hypothetical protein